MSLQDCTLYISWDEADLVLSYAALGLGQSDRRAIFDRHDTSSDARLNRVEFVSMCEETLSSVPMKRIHAAMANMNAARTSRKRRARAYWKTWSRQLDVWSRAVIPLAYAFMLVVVFTIELEDAYLTDQDATMRNGFAGSVHFSTAAVAVMITYVVAVIAVVTLWLSLKQAAVQQAASDQTELKVAGLESMKTVAKAATRKNLFEDSGAVSFAPPPKSSNSDGPNAQAGSQARTDVLSLPASGSATRDADGGASAS
jgi:hypothetical protein